MEPLRAIWRELLRMPTEHPWHFSRRTIGPDWLSWNLAQPEPAKRLMRSVGADNELWPISLSLPAMKP
jgi:hypothetical protein